MYRRQTLWTCMVDANVSEKLDDEMKMWLWKSFYCSSVWPASVNPRAQSNCGWWSCCGLVKFSGAKLVVCIVALLSLVLCFLFFGKCKLLVSVLPESTVKWQPLRDKQFFLSRLPLKTLLPCSRQHFQNTIFSCLDVLFFNLYTVYFLKKYIFLFFFLSFSTWLHN